jgi:DNA mismatch repair protein MutL
MLLILLKTRISLIQNVEVDSNFNPFRSEKVLGNLSESYKKESVGTWESLYVGLESKGNNSQQDFSEVQFESEEVTGSIFDENSNAEKTLKTFQLHNKYIVNTIKSGMLIINQQRAHQRVLYEDFLQHITVKEAVSQQLLFPLSLEFSNTEIIILKSLKEQLEQTGFVFSKLKGSVVELSGVPASVSEANVSIVLEQLINDVENEVPDSNFSQTDLLAKSLAKSLAIKTGQKLSIEEQENLVNRLFACKEPNISPTNRQTFITISVDDLDNKFM